MTVRCKLCGRTTICDRCQWSMLGVDIDASESATVTVTYDPAARRLIHVEAGTPAQVVAAWERLAREEGRPS